MPLLLGKASQFVAIRLCKQKELQPVNVARTKAFYKSFFVARMKYFSTRFILFSSTLSSAQLNLVKVSVMYVLSYVCMYVLRMAHTFNQVLFDMPRK